MIFIFADLEARRKAEATLRQSKERFATAFRFAPVPMLFTGLDGHRILNANHAFLEIDRAWQERPEQTPQLIVARPLPMREVPPNAMALGQETTSA